jgi:hypothetical protein
MNKAIRAIRSIGYGVVAMAVGAVCTKMAGATPELMAIMAGVFALAGAIVGWKPRA